MVIKVLYNIFTLGTIKRKKKIYIWVRETGRGGKKGEKGKKKKEKEN